MSEQQARRDELLRLSARMYEEAGKAHWDQPAKATLRKLADDLRNLAPPSQEQQP